MEAVLYLVPLVLLVGLWPLSKLLRQADRHARQLKVIERRLKLIMDHLGIAEPDSAMAEVRRYLDAGEKLQAIKAYREATGVGLKEAKEAVEALDAQLNK